MTQLKTSGVNVSDEWLNTNLLKIADSNGMFKQKTKEDIRKAIVGNIIQNPEIMQQFIMAALGQQAQPQQPPQQPPTQPGMEVPPEGMQGVDGAAMAEAMPMTDAVPQVQERM